MSDCDNDKQFKPADVGGFDVLDLSAFDIALRKLEQVVNEDSEKAELVLIEFARNDYRRAFHQFSQAFFKDAYFLHLDTEIEICKQRIHGRTIYPIFEDDYPVSEYIFKEYYYGDDGRCLPFTLKNEYGIDEQQVLVVNNNFPLEDVITWEGFIQSIFRFIDSVIDSRELSTVT